MHPAQNQPGLPGPRSPGTQDTWQYPTSSTSTAECCYQPEGRPSPGHHRSPSTTNRSRITQGSLVTASYTQVQPTHTRPPIHPPSQPPVCPSSPPLGHTPSLSLLPTPMQSSLSVHPSETHSHTCAHRQIHHTRLSQALEGDMGTQLHRLWSMEPGTENPAQVPVRPRTQKQKVTSLTLTM